jgi:hypothetical protein
MVTENDSLMPIELIQQRKILLSDNDITQNVNMVRWSNHRVPAADHGVMHIVNGVEWANSLTIVAGKGDDIRMTQVQVRDEEDMHDQDVP